MSLRGNENGPCESREAISKVLKNNEIATPAIKSGGLVMTKGVMTQPLLPCKFLSPIISFTGINSLPLRKDFSKIVHRFSFSQPVSL